MGDLTQSQGDQGESQGDQTEILGDQTQSQGDLTESLGDLTQGQGDLTESLGDLTQGQGDLTESLGDLTQSQDGQTQGDQSQIMAGHEGQIQGDQFLLNTPTITAPVSVSGLNLNLTVTCGKCAAEDICKDCNDRIACFLRLLNCLTAADPSQAGVTFYGSCGQHTSFEGTVADVADSCFAIRTPGSEGNLLFVSLDALEMVSVKDTGNRPNLFSRLLAYLQSADCSQDRCHCAGHGCNPCAESIASWLLACLDTGIALLISTSGSQANGYLYKLCHGVAYIVDNIENPTEITAIPICRIRCWQAQKGV